MRGRVQGVGFRWFTRDSAERLGVTGWVRNCPDGAVEGEAFGDTSVVDQFVAALRDGPPGSRVDDLTLGAATSMAPTTFEIRK